MLLDKFKNRLIIVCGHYGAGKTNVAVNLAATAAKQGKKVCIADFDVVNPYFRSADNEKQLAELGVRCIIPQFANTNVDIPSIPAEFQSVFISDELCIVDVGGDDGAIALSVYRDSFLKCGYDMVYVYNACRPLITETEDAVDSVKYIEAMSGLEISGIVNNTNLGEETLAEVVLAGREKCLALAKQTKKPFWGDTVFKTVTGIDGELFPMENATKQLF